VGGASTLVFASLTSLALQWRTVGRAFTMLRRARVQRPQSELENAMASIEVPGSWMIAGMIPIGIAMVAIQFIAFGSRGGPV